MNILLVQTSFLGDTILSTPVIAGIKQVFPQSRLWMMTTPLSADLVQRDPLLVDVISFDKRGKGSGLRGLLQMKDCLKRLDFDLVFSLHRSARTSLLLGLTQIPLRIGYTNAKLSFVYHRKMHRNPHEHDVLRNLSILSHHIAIDQLPQEMRLFAPDKGDVSSSVIEQLPPPGTYAVVVPGSAWETKRWHGRGYHEVCRYLLSQSIKVVLFGAKSDIPVSRQTAEGLDVIDLTGQTTISDSLYVIRQSRLVVCNDSMALHMASAFKIPNVAIFCATSPQFGFGPWKNKAIVVERKDLPCKPCRRHGSHKCPNGTEACMKGLPAEEVIDAVKTLVAD